MLSKYSCDNVDVNVDFVSNSTDLTNTQVYGMPTVYILLTPTVCAVCCAHIYTCHVAQRLQVSVLIPDFTYVSRVESVINMEISNPW